MYSIIKELNGEYTTHCTIQDGVESSTFKSKEEAVKSLIGDAKCYNNAKITRKSINFGVVRQVVVNEIFASTYDQI